jgi:hypothetical protein
LAFGTELKGEGAPQLKVRNRAGELVTVHCHPTQGAWHATVMKVVKRLDISPKEFQAWLREGKKPHPPSMKR